MRSRAIDSHSRLILNNIRVLLTILRPDNLTVLKLCFLVSISVSGPFARYELLCTSEEASGNVLDNVASHDSQLIFKLIKPVNTSQI